jgi:hypothetical protein
LIIYKQPYEELGGVVSLYWKIVNKSIHPKSNAAYIDFITKGQHMNKCDSTLFRQSITQQKNKIIAAVVSKKQL